MRAGWLLAAGAAMTALLGGVAFAADPPPRFGRYVPMHPGLYLDSTYGYDARDRSYDANGDEQRTAAPQAGGETSFPEHHFSTRLTWHLPLFEGQDVPFFSSRTHVARLTLRYQRMRTRGALAEFVANTADDASTEADDLRNNGSGVGDPTFEFGSFLLGSPVEATRGGTRPPYSLLLLAGVTAPFGVYDRDAPVSAGGNTTLSAHLQLGGHWRPWPGTFLEAGYTWREYFQNYDPAFGALDPAEQGDDHILDLGLTQRLLPGLYASVYGLDRRGGSNLYENPRFSPNRPTPGGRRDNFPTPGSYRDDGTALREAGVGLQWFATQRVLLGLHYSQPLSGRSGQFDLPYTERSPAGCTPGGSGCATFDGGSVLVDGMGPARSYASSRLTLAFTYQFGLGDAYPCPGCRR